MVVNSRIKHLGLPAVRGEEAYVARIAELPLSLEEFRAISPVFEEDIYDAISMKTCVEMRNTIGAPGQKAMQKVIEMEEAYLLTE